MRCLLFVHDWSASLWIGNPLPPLPRLVLQGFGEVGGFDVVGGAEVDDCAGEFQDVVVGVGHGVRLALKRAEGLSARIGPRRKEYSFRLTCREREVLRLLIQSMSDRDFTEALFISHYTVANHVSSILRKMDVDSRTAAPADAIRRNLD